MIKLIVENDQISILEFVLINSGINFQRVVECNPVLPMPYLMVDGVPLDEERALKWIEERNNGY